MNAFRQFAFVCMMFFTLNAHGQQPAPPDPKLEAMFRDYLDSWATTDKAKRIAKLEKLWTPTALHESPFARSVGMQAISDEIDGFQKMFPHAIVKFGDAKRTGKNVLVTFELRKSDNSVVATGWDYFELDDSGKIVKVIGFVN